MVKILGIDPGFKATGYGCIETDGWQAKLVETGTIEPRQKDLMQNRLKKIYTILGDLIEEQRPQILVLEKLYAHYKHPVTASKMGHVRGVICLLCAQKEIELAEYSVKRIRKALTGNGNASKAQTRGVVAGLLKVDESKLVFDASDALALAIGHARMQNKSI